MKRVAIESPFAGDVARNVAYAKRCMLDCLARGEAPYASHLLFTQEGLLDDTKRDERAQGIEAGLAWGAAAEVAAVYVDRGISPGMLLGVQCHASRGLRIECRALDRVVTAEDWRSINDIVNARSPARAIDVRSAYPADLRLQANAEYGKKGYVGARLERQRVAGSMDQALCREALDALGELWAAIPEDERQLYEQDRQDVESVLQRALRGNDNGT